MKDFFGKCGCNCGHCPAFKKNIQTTANQKRCRDGWNTYLGTTIKNLNGLHVLNFQRQMRIF